MSGVKVGDVLQGFGRANAGIFYTVVKVWPSGRVSVENHRTGRIVRIRPTHMRKVSA